MTTFKDMPPGERDAWLAFAQKHEWGSRSQFRDGRLVGCVAQRQGNVLTLAQPFADARDVVAFAKVNAGLAGVSLAHVGRA